MKDEYTDFLNSALDEAPLAKNTVACVQAQILAHEQARSRTLRRLTEWGICLLVALSLVLGMLLIHWIVSEISAQWLWSMAITAVQHGFRSLQANALALYLETASVILAASLLIYWHTHKPSRKGRIYS